MPDPNQPTPRREGEHGPAPQRGSRTFQKADGWYFMTRERVDVGPFASRELAEKGVEDYAGFSMDADKVYIDSLDTVPDESGLMPELEGGLAGLPVEAPDTDMFDRRRGDGEAAPVRHSRLLQNAEGWWFATREGSSIGPFPTEADAERGIQDFVSFAIDVEKAVASLNLEDDHDAVRDGQEEAGEDN